MREVSRPLRAVWSSLCALPAIRQDALLYLCAAIFAGGVFALNTGDYHAWGAIASVPYACGAIGCEVAWRIAGRRERAAVVERAREAIVLALMVGAVLVPLGALVSWRADGLPGPHAQPEVRVIEAAGDRAAAGHDPYLSRPATVGVSPSNDSRSVDSDSFFPYLPGMVPFGMINDLPGPKGLADGRLALAGFTFVVAAIALLACEAPRGRRGRALQVLIVLPTGAMPIATGGDDLPVLAFMLLALVLADRRRPVLCGVAMGLGGTLKLTAWPLLALLALAQRDRRGRSGLAAYCAAVVVVTLPALLSGILPDPGAFVTNVVRFPLGLTTVKSPAASPLLGQVLTTVFPRLKTEITAALVILGMVIVCVFLWRRTPRSPAAAARFTGLALLLGTVLSPATRFGYLIYPANLLVWAYMLDGAEEARAARGPGPAAGSGQDASSTWTRFSSRRLVGAV